MGDLSVEIRLRPARIALLVRPSDATSIGRFMRISACMWGGLFNPIIPVFQVGPKEWRKEKWRRTTGKDVARGYIEFFEPDAFIEAEAGLAAEVGLEHLQRKYVSHSRVIPLDALLRKREPLDYAELAMGLTGLRCGPRPISD